MTPTCPVTVWPNFTATYHPHERCGLPVARHGLCAKHAADKERLST